MSTHIRTIAAWVGVAVTIVGMGTSAIASYGRLEERVTQVERDQREDSRRLRRIEVMVARMCAVTPGCE